LPQRFAPHKAARSSHDRAAPRLSVLEPFELTPAIPFVNVGERTTSTGSANSASSSRQATTPRRLQVARDQSRTAADHRRHMDEGPARFRSRMVTFLNLVAAEPTSRACP